MDDELGPPVGIEVRINDGLVVFRDQHLSVRGILLGEEEEARVYHSTGQRKDIQRSVDEVIPFASYVQAADLSKASSLVFDCSKDKWKRRWNGLNSIGGIMSRHASA